MVLPDMQSPFPGERKMLGLPPAIARSSRNTATAWRDRGQQFAATAWKLRLEQRRVPARQSAPTRSDDLTVDFVL